MATRRKLHVVHFALDDRSRVTAKTMWHLDCLGSHKPKRYSEGGQQWFHMSGALSIDGESPMS
jgi:hypothetical protein